MAKGCSLLLNHLPFFLPFFFVVRVFLDVYPAYCMCLFDASDGHPILGHFARQVGRSGEIRGPGMTWMTYGCRRVDLTVSICFDVIFNYTSIYQGRNANSFALKRSGV